MSFRVHPTAEPLAPCTFMIQTTDKTWTYCGRFAPSIWIATSAGFYRRCDLHQPSQHDRHTSVQGIQL